MGELRVYALDLYWQKGRQREERNTVGAGLVQPGSKSLTLIPQTASLSKGQTSKQTKQQLYAPEKHFLNVNFYTGIIKKKKSLDFGNFTHKPTKSDINRNRETFPVTVEEKNLNIGSFFFPFSSLFASHAVHSQANN